MQAAGRPTFQTTPDGRRRMDDLDLACRVKAALVKEQCFDLGVTAEYGNVVVYTQKGGRQTGRLEARLEEVRRTVPGINHLEMREGLPVPSA